jgi:DNA polymerase delta subunit 4
MAPKRRSSTGPAKASATQSTLAFHGSSNKITKPTALPRSAKSHTKIDDIPTSIKTEEPSVKAEPEVDEVIIQAPAVAVPAPSKSDKQLEAEKEARKVSEARIKKYWTAKEKTRMAPRVHQEDLSLHEKVLREWDMCGLYGVRSPFPFPPLSPLPPFSLSLLLRRIMGT